MTINKSLKIFLLDEDNFCLAMYQQCLENMGCTNITVFNNEADCIAMLPQMPDVVFAECQTDINSATEVLNKIKQFNADIYVVFLSGIEDSYYRDTALQNGAFEYIVKGNNDIETMHKVLTGITKIQSILSNK